MAQFDVYKNPRGGPFPLFVDVQSDSLARTSHRVVVPMVPRKKQVPPPIARLNPIAPIGGVEYVLVVQNLAAVPVSALRERVASLAPRRVDIVAALDLLFTGI